MQVVTRSNCSPRLCLLLKTLLFLLCIYIKRVTAAPLSNCTIDPILNDTLRLSDQTFFAPEYDFTLYCPTDQMVEEKPRCDKADRAYIEKLRDDILSKMRCVDMLKNEKPFYRESANDVLFLLNSSEPQIKLINVGQTDQALYTFIVDYPNITRQALKYFTLYRRAEFNLFIWDKSDRLQDSKPTIHEYPVDKYVHRGETITFKCLAEPTLTSQTIRWFKSPPDTGSNVSAIKQYLQNFENVKNGKIDIGKLQSAGYLIEDKHDHEWILQNVTDNDIGYYGCLIENSKGFNMRHGRLDIFENKVTLERSQAASVQVTKDSNVISYVIIIVIVCGFISTCVFLTKKIRIQKLQHKDKDQSRNHLVVPEPIVGIGTNDKPRQHLPSGGCPDVYNTGKVSDGFISGHLMQRSTYLMAQSTCNQILDKEKNPSISSNSNSDEASSWGNNSRAFYLHTSNTTTTTVPLYDHPPSTGAAQLCGAMVQDACVINPTYGFLRPDFGASDWLFPRRNLERLNKIGEGQFGEVWRYTARQKDGSVDLVAVKQLKERVGVGHRERLELLAEIEIMKSVNNHPNVIKLLNYCVEDSQPILLIMEYAENGKLQEYLRNCRLRRKESVTSKELVTFSYHVAKGMEYVSSQGIIHRDLASRNILVSRDKVCKVADFGFARRVSDDVAYERTTGNPVPVKWMAPEALIENKFTTKSDVYSLGILMWEIVTLGATPYESLNSAEVVEHVNKGSRLEKPAHCRDEFYNIMVDCWRHDPAQRPTFKEVARQLEKLVLSETDYIELDQYPEHAYYNIVALLRS